MLIERFVDRASWYSLITRTNLIHLTITFSLLKLKASTCFGHYLPIHIAATVLSILREVHENGVTKTFLKQCTNA
jgi:hypothetical protein